MESNRASINELAKACAGSADAAEWGEFLSRCAPLAQIVALRYARMFGNGSSPTMVDDIVQEVFLKLCEQDRRILREFEPRGEDSFFGLLRIVAGSVANDHFRRVSSVKRGGKVVTMALLDDSAPAPSELNRQSAHIHRSVLLQQLDRKMRSAPHVVGERDRALFWLCYSKGFTTEEIAGFSATGLSAKGVESALRRVATWLREQVES